ncbi:MAG: CsbD family protein [Dethiobacteria bacterium]
MNEDILKGKWSELKGKAKKKWGKLTDDDLMVISGQKEKLVGVLQTKYGYAKEKAEEEYKSFLDGEK